MTCQLDFGEVALANGLEEAVVSNMWVLIGCGVATPRKTLTAAGLCGRCWGISGAIHWHVLEERGQGKMRHVVHSVVQAQPMYTCTRETQEKSHQPYLITHICKGLFMKDLCEIPCQNTYDTHATCHVWNKGTERWTAAICMHLHEQLPKTGSAYSSTIVTLRDRNTDQGKDWVPVALCTLQGSDEYESQTDRFCSPGVSDQNSLMLL